MALGVANNQLYQKVQQQQKILCSRTIYQNNQRTIAPAPYTKTKPTSLYAAGTTLDSNNPAVIRRNARERNRVKQVNNGFSNLRQHIPVSIIADLSNGRRGIGPGANKKLSKVDTLRMAVEYIRRLKRVIDDVDNSDVSSVSSFNSCDTSNSGSPSSPPQDDANASGNHYKTQYYFPTNGGFTFPPQKHQSFSQPQLQQIQLISPTASISSSTYSFDSSYQQASPANDRSMMNTKNNYNGDVQVKFEQCYDDYPNASTDDDDDNDILDYISLWQDEL